MSLAVRKNGNKVFDLWCGEPKNFHTDLHFSLQIPAPDWEKVAKECEKGFITHTSIELTFKSENQNTSELITSYYNSHFKNTDTKFPRRLTLIFPSLGEYEEAALVVEKL